MTDSRYDFHKVRQADQQGEGNPYGEGAWEFRHPDFSVHNRDALDNIKRKAPAAKRVLKQDQPHLQQMGMEPGEYYPGQMQQQMQLQIDSLKGVQANMNHHLQALTKNYQSVISEMLNFQRNIVAQDQVMQNLISYLMNNGGSNSGNAAVGDEQAQKLVNEYTEVARASYEQIEGMTRRASHLGLMPDAIGQPWPQDASIHPQFQQPQHPSYDMGEPLQAQAQHNYNPYTQDMRQPQLQQQPTGHSPGAYSASNGSQTPGPNYHTAQFQPHPAADDRRHQQQMRQTPKEEVRDPLQSQRYKPTAMAPPYDDQAVNAIRTIQAAKANTVSWAVAPKILLVEDDQVCRRLSTKFLSFFGCEIDTATDGVSAVNKMNEKKYDLVLMDIVMPNLDGVSATSLIRQFDPLTPIISMTSNVQSGDVMTYFSHGMNDILPKPFTKDGLLGMLEKHLIHLKTIKQQGLSSEEQRILSMAEGGKDGEVGVSEAEYLGMLSGLMGGTLPLSNLRRTADEMQQTRGQPDPDEKATKKARLDDVK